MNFSRFSKSVTWIEVSLSLQLPKNKLLLKNICSIFITTYITSSFTTYITENLVRPILRRYHLNKRYHIRNLSAPFRFIFRIWLEILRGSIIRWYNPLGILTSQNFHYYNSQENPKRISKTFISNTYIVRRRKRCVISNILEKVISVDQRCESVYYVTFGNIFA